MAIKKYEIYICDYCYNLVGEMCHDPECVFCRRTMEDVSCILNNILIRPIIDGKQHQSLGNMRLNYDK